MRDNFELKRTMEPITDGIRYKLVYTAETEGYLTLEELIRSGPEAENAMKNELTEALIHEVRLYMEAAEAER